MEIERAKTEVAIQKRFIYRRSGFVDVDESRMHLQVMEIDLGSITQDLGRNDLAKMGEKLLSLFEQTQSCSGTLT